MPYKAKHTCNHHGCTRLVSGRYCVEHERQVREQSDDARGTATERGYDAQWAKVRSMKLRANPLCERCAKGLGWVLPMANGQDTPAYVKAHIVHHKDRNPKNNIASNLESLCRECHDAEHKQERFGKQKPTMPQD